VFPSRLFSSLLSPLPSRAVLLLRYFMVPSCPAVADPASSHRSPHRSPALAGAQSNLCFDLFRKKMVMSDTFVFLLIIRNLIGPTFRTQITFSSGFVCLRHHAVGGSQPSAPLPPSMRNSSPLDLLFLQIVSAEPVAPLVPPPCQRRPPRRESVLRLLLLLLHLLRPSTPPSPLAGTRRGRCGSPPPWSTPYVASRVGDFLTDSINGGPRDANPISVHPGIEPQRLVGTPPSPTPPGDLRRHPGPRRPCPRAAPRRRPHRCAAPHPTPLRSTPTLPRISTLFDPVARHHEWVGVNHPCTSPRPYISRAPPVSFWF